MKRHERRAVDAKHRSFTASLVSDRDPREEIGKEVKAKFIADLKQYGSRETMCNVFGEVEGSDGYLEEVIYPKTGGTLTRIYGCSYLFKGYATKVQVEGLQLAKSMMSGLLRDIVGGSFALSSAVAFLFIFQRRKFLTLADRLFWDIENRVVDHYDIPVERYNQFGRELMRATELTLEHEDNLWVPVIRKVSRLLILFLELDNAYRFRLQDAFGMETGQHGTDDLFARLKLILSRETAYGISPKWKFIHVALIGAFFASPTLKRIATHFMDSLDRTKLTMDESDRYFCLKWRSYNFGGLTQDERYKLRELADRERGHVFLL